MQLGYTKKESSLHGVDTGTLVGFQGAFGTGEQEALVQTTDIPLRSSWHIGIQNKRILVNMYSHDRKHHSMYKFKPYHFDTSPNKSHPSPSSKKCKFQLAKYTHHARLNKKHKVHQSLCLLGKVSRCCPWLRYCTRVHESSKRESRKYLS